MQEFDEDELEAELNALGDELELEEQEELDKQLLDVGPAVPSSLPEVQTVQPARKEIHDSTSFRDSKLLLNK